MKTIYKSISNLCLAGLFILGAATTAEAQRGGGGFHGGGGGGFRGGFSGGGGFRGGVSVGGGYRGYGYGGSRVGVGIGFGGYRSYPRIGLSLGYLPYGYYPFFYGPDQYYYYGGAFYQPYNGGYQVVAPPVGAEIPSLPQGARAINIDGSQYYEFNGVYYKQAVTPDHKTVYIVAGKDGVLNTNGDVVGPDTVVGQAPAMPQVGDMRDDLPQDARKIMLNHKRYWVTAEDIYLEEVKTDKGVSYRVVSVPDNGSGDQ